MYLCFGTYATTLKICSLNGITDKEIVGCLIKIIDPDSAYDQTDNASSISRLINCKANFHMAASEENSGKNRKNGGTLTRAFNIAKTKMPIDIVPAVRSFIVPLLDEDKKSLLVLILREIIRNNGCSYDDEKKFKKYIGYSIEEFSGCTRFNLEMLLSGMLIYTIIIGNNNTEEGRKTIEQIRRDGYIKKLSDKKESIVFENFDITSVFPGKRADVIALNNDKKYGWAEIYKEFNYILKDEFPNIYESVKRVEILKFISEAFEAFNIENISKSCKMNIMAGLLSASLRSLYYDEILCLTDRARLKKYNVEIQNLIDEFSIIHPTDILISLFQAENLDVLSKNSNYIFYRSVESNEQKSAISFAVLAIFFTDLYFVLTKYAYRFADMICYKTNANVSNSLNDFGRHVFFQTQPFQVDENRHRLDVCLTCDEANSHKAAALFVNEFERALNGFEEIFSYIGFQIYYIRAKIQAFGRNNIVNYNFEAYTPTLMPLLSGGHLYSSHMVFIRELVQNAIDSIAVRKEAGDNDEFVDDIKILMCIADDKKHLSALVIEDSGMGMGRAEIERYLTSIGRSFYTAGDFKKMNLAYRPISSFGIGFLSCFLVCSNIDICTHSMANEKTFQLSIPNIEGCFFIEESKENFHVGTRIVINMGKSHEQEGVFLLDMLEYVYRHFLDVRFDIRFSWDAPDLTIMYPVDPDGRCISILNSDIAELMLQEMHAAPCPFGFANEGVILETDYCRTFSCDWWNRYMKKQLGGIQLGIPDKAFSELTIQKHAIRKIGKIFFLFVPFEVGGDVPDIQFNTIESTYEYSYGIFITDLPDAGIKIRSKSNGIRSYSGVLRILNAGILIDDGSIEPLFGQVMRIFVSDNETAYNNVIINFPPDWIELNVSREKIIGLSNENVCRERLLKGIARYVLKELNLFNIEKQKIPLVNIQEIASLITVICTDLNSDTSGEGKELLTKLKEEKFLLLLSVTEDGICFIMSKDHGEDMDMKTWFNTNHAFLSVKKDSSPAFVTENFFRDFEMQTGKKGIESIEKMNYNMSEQFNIPERMAEKLGHDLSILLFAAYIIYFPDNRISKYAVKASHARLNIERQLQKKYTIADVVEGNACEFISFKEIQEFLNQFKN